MRKTSACLALFLFNLVTVAHASPIHWDGVPSGRLRAGTAVVSVICLLVALLIAVDWIRSGWRKAGMDAPATPPLIRYLFILFRAAAIVVLGGMGLYGLMLLTRNGG